MKTTNITISKGFSHLANMLSSFIACISLPWQAWRKSQGGIATDDLPLRAELFSAAQMEQHGRVLSESQRLASKPGRNRLLNRLAENEDVIIDACAHLISAIQQGRQVTPAAEWLLDNFYIIEDQIYTAKRHLPKNYSQQLPRLSNGNSHGLPRVYELALEVIAHGDGRIDPDNLSSFISAFQEKQGLMLGELWAIPIMLRLALIENLRRVAVSIKEARLHRNLACEWADRLAKGVEDDSNNLILLVADMARSNPPMQSTFVAEFVRCLQAQNPSLLLPLSWLTQRLAESNQHIEGMIHSEAQQQAADQVSISNSIASLRLLSSIDWQIFVENLSHVEHCLKRDPHDVYSHMSFATRDQYRHVVEHVARHSTMSELEVAQTALLLAVQSNVTRDRKHSFDDPEIADTKLENHDALDRPTRDDLRATHVGYYLIGDGKQKLENSVKYRTPFHKAWRVYLGRYALSLYLLSIFLLSVVMCFALLTLVDLYSQPLAIILFTSLFCWIALSQFGVCVVNWGVTMMTIPRPLARMDFSLGIPAESASMVVIPCMFTSQTNIDRLVEALEIRFLGNQDKHLRFCLLSDFADASTATMPQDVGLLRYAEKSIALLNQKYRHGIVNSGNVVSTGNANLIAPVQAANDDVGWNYFLLFHRPRLWNEQEQCWMGYERKRGKLAALNAYLRGNGRQAFSLIVGADDTLLKTRYIITLDADTELPRDAARKFVATMAHPLNRARYDTQLQRVTAGYGILQPRIAVSLPGARASRYELLCAGEVGIDPYTRTVSDVYQDLFGEGSFIGKGIYEIDTFELALKDRLPENRILSHDLLEGCYARAGLLSDVELHEQQPASYQADAMRRHRWIRGDWQIASWLLSRVPTHADYQKNFGHACQNPLSPLSRWKLLDNLRRSLVPIVLMGLLVISWSRFPLASFGVIVALVSLCGPGLLSILHFIMALIEPRADLNWRGALKSALWQTKQQLTQIFLSISFLPFEAYSHLDAILRTQWRISISKKQLLEWTPSSETNRHAGDSWRATYRSMWIAPLSSVVIILGLAIWRPEAIAGALGFLILWLFAPLSAAWISRAASIEEPTLTQTEEKYLRVLARKTWLFFERYVNAENNWLPPDNVQEFPIPVVARRTSPTNIGLSLLANLTAYDFSYISAGRLVERCDLCVTSMERLPRFQGHFYNWYSTENLQPLLPQYVSTVDSGNLAGHMLVLRSGLLNLPAEPVFRWSYFDALKDTYQILCSYLTESGVKSLAHLGVALDQACMSESSNLLVAHRALIEIRDLCNKVPEFLSDENKAQTSAPSKVPAEDPIQIWRDALATQSQDLLTDLEQVCPWLHKSHLLSHDRIQEFSELSLIPSHQSLVQLHEDFLHRIDQFQKTESKNAEHVNSDKSDGESRREGGNGNDVASDGFDVNSSVDSAEQIQAQFNQFILSVHQLTLLASARASERLLVIKTLCAKIDDLSRMEFEFLYNRTSHLLAIGYNVTDRRLDSGAYDLLASEARLATFVGIAQNKLPQESWFALGRQLTIAQGEPILLSWSGSMFEYLMPLLVMPDFKHTLLHQTYHATVQRQIDYGQERQIPWGISESAYNLTDSNLNYQYRAFGVPGLGYKRSLGDDLVVAPYATMMALMVMPKQAYDNLQRMSAMGFEGQYGFYEAIDFTSARLARAQTHVVIRSFMSHHQGMSLLALAYLLLDRPLQKRFVMEARFQAALPLLHERVPKTNSNYSNTSELADIRMHSNQQEMAMRVLHRADHRTPEVQLLSNGRYHLMITSAGGSASRWNDLAINRWREDATRDQWGSFCYLRELDAKGKTIDHFWSSTFQPSLIQPDNMEVIFSEGRAEFRRTDHQLLQHTEIVVSPEDDIELRRTHITNRSRSARILELTSYSEVVLNYAAADAMHPAFSNLFVETEIDFEQQAILCQRRRRSESDSYPWMFHLIAVHGTSLQSISYETDRSRFIGRTQNLNNPRAMQESGALSNSHGAVLDPIVAIRIQIRIEPEQTVSIDLVTGIASNRQHALSLIDKYRDRHLADRVIELSWTHSQVTLRQLNISESEAQIYARLASSIIFVNPLLRADPQILIQNRRGQSALWSYAISGDLPIVLVKIKDQTNLELVRQLIKAHTYWKSKGLAVDLVIWNEEHNGYRQILQEQIAGLVAGIVAGLVSPSPAQHAQQTHGNKEKTGGIFLRSLDQISTEDRQLFLSVARISLSDTQGSLLEQMNRRPAITRTMPDLISPDMFDGGTTYLASLLGQNPKQKPSAFTQAKKENTETLTSKVTKPIFDSTTLLENNGTGGFARDGRSYVVHTQPQIKTPAPWVNVIANAQLGTVISESGQAYTWVANAHEFRLTPWSNDAVTDAGAEVFYIRNERTGKFWSPLPLPIPSDTDYVCRHGFGYSEFEHEEEQIASHLTVFVSLDAPIKYTVLRLHNRSQQKQDISLTSYVEWVLGDTKEKTQMHINTHLEKTLANGAQVIVARNPYHAEFSDCTAFHLALCNDTQLAMRQVPTHTADRNEFIGRNRSLENPVAMEKRGLSGKLGAGMDACAAFQYVMNLEPNESREFVFILGALDVGTHSGLDTISSLLTLYSPIDKVKQELQAVHQFWQKTLSVIQVKTPEPSFDLLANGWLLYQTLSARMWGRSGFYQSGGAFGFRDQLQDSMALVHSQPTLVRQHLLLAAAHQFIEGDVQHWWHPPGDRGVRTRCSDDFLWLVAAVHRYVTVTGDKLILEESVGFLEGRPLNHDEDSYYDSPQRSQQVATLYAHCVAAIEYANRLGDHGLCLIGSGDWNDGFDLVGHLGKGESVWLSFFAYQILNDFLPIAQAHGDKMLVARWRDRASALHNAIESSGWDGAWYRRAYFDDGTPIGSAQNEVCQIDSIAQSWAVLSGVGNKQHNALAMQSMLDRLVNTDAGLVQLLAPPFDQEGQNPGYIRAYVPGVRENGGQYTHAAIWAVMALCKLDHKKAAWELIRMINPIHHGNSANAIARYKVEPYVLAADVYAVEPHIGRGGWTWYTGSAAWMVRAMWESLLGLEIKADQLRICPCIPDEWDGFSMSYQYRSTCYEITVKKTTYSGTGLSLDEVPQLTGWITMNDDGKTHQVMLLIPMKATSDVSQENDQSDLH